MCCCTGYGQVNVVSLVHRSRRLLVAVRSALYLLDWGVAGDASLRLLTTVDHGLPDNVINEGKADAQGRFWAGKNSLWAYCLKPPVILNELGSQTLSMSVCVLFSVSAINQTCYEVIQLKQLFPLLPINYHFSLYRKIISLEIYNRDYSQVRNY